MPIYEYKCNSCGKAFETLLIGSDQPECPACKSTDLARLLSACGFVSKSTDPGGASKKVSSFSSACSGCAATSCGTCSSG